MLDWIMTALAAFAFMVAGVNVAYSMFSNGHYRHIVMAQGLICAYIGVIYSAYLANLIPEPYWMRHLMRGGIFVVLLLFLVNTLTLWWEKGDD